MMQSNTIHESDGNVVQTVKSFADLPPEMVIAIFSHVGTSELLNIRRVNRQWNAISTEIIRNRNDITLDFKLHRGTFIQRIPNRRPEKLLLFEHNRTSALGSRNLDDLVACLQNSKHLQQFPCTAFQFDAMPYVRGEDMQNFLKIFGENICSLKVGLYVAKCNDILQVIFESTPNLKTLEINFCSDVGSRWPPLVVGGISVDLHRTLLNLEVLSVFNFSQTYSKIIEDILTMSPKLKSFSFGDIPITVKNLQMLESTNKLNCLKTLRIHIGKDIVAHWKKSLKCFDLQLEHLHVRVSESVIEDPQLKLDATEIVSQLFHSSKDVMRTLCTECSNFLTLLSELQLPKLEKLQTLHLIANFEIVRPLLNWLTSSPNIKELEVDLMSFGSLKSQQIRLPSVELVRISYKKQRDIRNLIEITPNAKTLLLVDVMSFWHERIIVSLEDISALVPKLVNFGWWMRCPGMHSQHNLDAVLTGLPDNLCKQLAEKFRNKDDGLSAEEIAAYQRDRVSSSIVDLKDLRHLELDFTCFRSDAISLKPDGHFCKTGMTKVSKLLGFDLIPDLKVLVLHGDC